MRAGRRQLQGERWRLDRELLAAHRSRRAFQLCGELRHRRGGFALFEVLIGVTIFVVGVLALGRSVENCLNASALSAQEDRVRQILANRMAEIQATPGLPDENREERRSRPATGR